MGYLRKLTAAAVTMTLATFGPAVHADLVIDLFETDQTNLVDSSPSSPAETGGVFSQVFSGGGDILGDYRDLGVAMFSNGDVSSRTVEIGVGGGVLDFSVDTLAKGSGLIRWDGAHAATSFSDIDYTGLGGVDLASVATGFEIGILFADGIFTFSLEAYTDSDTWSRIDLVSQEHFTPFNQLISLGAFALCDFSNASVTVTCGTDGAVDFSNLGALQAILDPTASSTAIDLTLDLVRAVPEPGSLALAGLALLGLGAVRRRAR